MKQIQSIIDATLARYPKTQALYLFGGFGSEHERPDSDVDLGLLLAPAEARAAGALVLGDLRFELESLLDRDVDLINLREVSTVLQKEVVMADRRIYTGDEYAADEFEMLTLSFYVKLNEERAGIIAAALAGGRFHQV